LSSCSPQLLWTPLIYLFLKFHRLVGQSLLANTPFEGAISEDGIDPTSVEGVADTPYDIPNLAVELHTTHVGVPVLWWRSVGHTHTAFAVEVFLDELAAAAGRDPVEWRRTLMANHPRHRGVLDLAAEKAGLTPIKLNAVVVKGYNEADVVDLARLTVEHPWQMRFIEMMPFAGVTDVQTSQVITAAQILARIESELGRLEDSNDGKLDGEARVFHIPQARGDIGFISTVTAPFCETCNRARLTADGRLRLCLLREKEVDLLTPLRAGASLEDLRRLILDGIWYKPWGHGLAEGVIPLNRVMNEIGG